ncbi:MAG: dihydropteroate synthase [Bacteroidales bacterium]|jgi:dihydropteroate synthase|nr:dihydropteroate synthase [Bacteroidales bacterium]
MMFLNLKGNLRSLEQPVIMGIANFTEDSFFDGGQYNTIDELLKRVETLLEEGADIVDLGAVSTRPGAKDLDEKEEFNCIKLATKAIIKNFPDVLLSIDTWRASVAEMSIHEGAAMINDISGGTFDKNMIPTISKLKVPYCLMHTTTKPETMQQNTAYQNIMQSMLFFLGQQLHQLKTRGVNDIIIDPGFGFGKTLDQNYYLLNNLEAFFTFNLPVLVGISRKSMIYNLLKTTPQEALNGTTILNTIAVLKGAHILRVHDVKEAKEVVKMVRKMAN